MKCIDKFRCYGVIYAIAATITPQLLLPHAVNGFSIINTRRDKINLSTPPFLSSSSSLRQQGQRTPTTIIHHLTIRQSSIIPSYRRSSSSSRSSPTALYFWKDLIPGKKKSSTETTEPESTEEDDEDDKKVVAKDDDSTKEKASSSTPFFATLTENDGNSSDSGQTTATIASGDTSTSTSTETTDETEMMKTDIVGNDDDATTATTDFGGLKLEGFKVTTDIGMGVSDGDTVVTTEVTPTTTTVSDSDEIEVITDGAAATVATDDDDQSVADNDITPPQPPSPSLSNDNEKPDDNSSSSITTPNPPPPTKSSDSVMEQAMALRKQAEKTRLEAERMDAILTLEKLSKLEKSLESKSVINDAEKAAEVRLQIDVLKRKLDPSSSPPAASDEKASATAPVAAATTTISPPKVPNDSSSDDDDDAISPDELQRRTDAFLSTPPFLRNLVAKMAGFENADNVTAVVLKIYQDEKDVEKMERQLRQPQMPDIDNEASWSGESLEKEVERFEQLPRGMRDLAAQFLGFEDASNSTAVMLAMREKERKDALARKEGSSFSSSTDPPGSKEINESSSSSSQFFGDDSKSDKERMVESLFPRTTRKEGETPTLAQVQLFASSILSSQSFLPSEPPEAIPGGYIIRGNSRKDDPDDLITAIDAKLETSPLKDQLAYYYVYDPTPVTEEQMMSGDRPPVLLITSKDISRPFNLLLPLVTAFGVAGISFLSIYPFALDQTIARKVEEQLALNPQDADLSFLTDLSTPIFASYLGLQFVHDIGHIISSKLNKFDISIPTWIPSPTLGITSSITTIQSPPRNKNALVDFALSGPLTAMLASTLVLVTGLSLARDMDPATLATLPQLPVGFLRQSALAGGIIEGVLGRGTLDSADPFTSTIPIHPLAIAGYTSLLVNALALLPFGRTDGGRLSFALLGRTGAQLVSLICGLGMLVVGLFASDALLFYFSFALFFESELEVPLKDEVSDVSFERVIVIVATAVLVLLTVIPVGL